MIGNLTTSEKRFLAALDRIDTSIERAAKDLRESAAAQAAPAEASAGGEGTGASPDREAALLETNRRLADELAAAQSRIAMLENELAQAGAQVVELAAANEALAQANHTLLARADSGGADEDGIRAALEAENEALRMARAAEMARIGAIVTALDDLLGQGAAESLLSGAAEVPDARPDAAAAADGNKDQETDEGR